MKKSFKKLQDMHFFSEDLGDNKAVIDSEQYNAWVNHFIGNLFLFQEEKEMIDQGILEIKEENFQLIKNSSGLEIKNQLKGNFYLISSFKESVLKEDGTLKDNFNFFNDFFNDLSTKKDIDFEKYILTEQEINDFQATNFIPYRYLYKERIKIVCLLDNSNENIFIVGYIRTQNLNSTSFLQTIMTETVDFKDKYRNPL